VYRLLMGLLAACHPSYLIALYFAKEKRA